MIDFLLRFTAAREYAQKFENMPDNYMYNELYTLASLRNSSSSAVVSPYGNLDTSYTEPHLSNSDLKMLLDTVWKDVKQKHERKYWYFEVNQRMKELQVN